MEFIKALIYFGVKWVLRISALWIGLVLGLDLVERLASPSAELEAYPFTTCYLLWPYRLLSGQPVDCFTRPDSRPEVFSEWVWGLLLLLIVLLVAFPALATKLAEYRYTRAEARLAREKAAQEDARQAEQAEQKRLRLIAEREWHRRETARLLLRFKAVTSWYETTRSRRPWTGEKEVKPDGEL